MKEMGGRERCRPGPLLDERRVGVFGCGEDLKGEGGGWQFAGQAVLGRVRPASDERGGKSGGQTVRGRRREGRTIKRRRKSKNYPAVKRPLCKVLVIKHLRNVGAFYVERLTRNLQLLGKKGPIEPKITRSRGGVGSGQKARIHRLRF